MTHPNPSLTIERGENARPPINAVTLSRPEKSLQVNI